MKEFNDITEAADLLADIYLELKEINEGSKEYLDEFLKESEEAQEHYPTIEEYDNCVLQSDDLYHVRIYDLALYNITKELVSRIEKIGQ